jgi:hypothetical protein
MYREYEKKSTIWGPPKTITASAGDSNQHETATQGANADAADADDADAQTAHAAEETHTVEEPSDESLVEAPKCLPRRRGKGKKKPTKHSAARTKSAAQKAPTVAHVEQQPTVAEPVPVGRKRKLGSPREDDDDDGDDEDDDEDGDDEDDEENLSLTEEELAFIMSYGEDSSAALSFTGARAPLPPGGSKKSSAPTVTTRKKAGFPPVDPECLESNFDRGHYEHVACKCADDCKLGVNRLHGPLGYGFGQCCCLHFYGAALGGLLPPGAEPRERPQDLDG